MIRVLGGPKRLCDGLTRRDLLQVGSLGVLGAGLGGRVGAAPEASSTAGLPGFGRAKSCIMLFLYGSHSQIETFDPKPDAPSQIRGEFGAIPTSVPGVNFCEGLPNLAAIMDKITVIRSVSHPFPVHGVAYATTGNPAIPLAMELSPRDPAHWPFIGSVVDYMDAGRGGGAADRPEVPRNLQLPFAFSSQRIGEVARAGPYGGFLGQAYDPICTEFLGQGTKKASKTLAALAWDDLEPYRGITPDSRFQISGVNGPSGTVTLDQLDRRRTLLQQLEDAHRGLSAGPAIDRHRETAYRLLQSPTFRQAFDLDLETWDTRALYGMTLFGQATLTARRLVEAGGRFVSVFWDEYGLAGTGWDTHWDHFPRMKDELLPGLDRTLSGLILDLDRRGTLDETLVVLLSEHGRTPQIGNVPGGGRDHWSRCYSVVMAGGGIGRGRVLGKSDKIGGDPVERRVSPKDVLATMYHLLGIDPAAMIRDRLGRPLPLVADAEVISEVLA
ncbi:DUF1501 domain-containing protein [Paludisphaera mucosa]|uniref:DUF1501 domain-containing protein n=1 Tax=Paludisphaera mucosa TaxID=3030827 RepID=A0ABT6F870_9BACT|nr:DUF1501 domain-containing protein [Paludisphaera mucosa]MDG3003786.1 DUF1501 domain-containing protein [Paludisphaera mucosa]